MNVKIVEFPETRVAVVEHLGPPETEHESVRRLVAWRIENRMSPDKHATYGIHYNDPRTTPAAEYRVDLCVAVEHEVSQNPQGLVNRVIPGGRYAVARHHGSRKNVEAAAYLYESWLPLSGETVRDFPIFFHRLMGRRVRRTLEGIPRLAEAE